MAAQRVEPPYLPTDLKTLCLSTVAARWRPLAEQATRQRQAPADYQAQLVHLEVSGRRERRIQRRIQDARFPMLKTLDAFSFEAQPGLDRDVGPADLRPAASSPTPPTSSLSVESVPEIASVHRLGDGLLPARLPGAVRLPLHVEIDGGVPVRGRDTGVAEPLTDRDDVDAGAKQVDRRAVAHAVGMETLGAQGRHGGLRADAVLLQQVADAESCQPGASRRRSATLRTTISWTRAGVEHGGEERVVGATVDGVAIDDAQDGFDLLVLEVLHGAAAGPLERDGEEASTVREPCGVLQGAVPEERMGRGEAHIAGGDAVVAVELEVLEKREDRMGAEVFEVELDDGPLRPDCDDREARARGRPGSSGSCVDSCLAPEAGGRRRTPGGLAPRLVHRLRQRGVRA